MSCTKSRWPLLLALSVLAVTAVDCRKDKDGLHRRHRTRPRRPGRQRGPRPGRQRSRHGRQHDRQHRRDVGPGSAVVWIRRRREGSWAAARQRRRLDGRRRGRDRRRQWGRPGETGNDAPANAEAGVEGGSSPGGCGVFYARCCAGACTQPNLVCVAANPPPSPTDVCVSCGRRGDYCCTGGKCEPGPGLPGLRGLRHLRPLPALRRRQPGLLRRRVQRQPPLYGRGRQLRDVPAVEAAAQPTSSRVTPGNPST